MMRAAYLEVRAEVRYWEDSVINNTEDTAGDLVPLREGKLWCPIIRLADGLVMDWPDNTEADIHYKVCDAGEYWLLDDGANRIAKWGGYYVPDDFLCPTANGYGDYIIMKIQKGGLIKDWRKPEIQMGCSCNDDDSESVWIPI